jgi:hypothetical protein
MIDMYQLYKRQKVPDYFSDPFEGNDDLGTKMKQESSSQGD